MSRPFRSEFDPRAVLVDLAALKGQLDPAAFDARLRACVDRHTETQKRDLSRAARDMLYLETNLGEPLDTVCRAVDVYVRDGLSPATVDALEKLAA